MNNQKVLGLSVWYCLLATAAIRLMNLMICKMNLPLVLEAICLHATVMNPFYHFIDIYLSRTSTETWLG